MVIKKLTYNDIDKKLNLLIKKVKILSEMKNRKVKKIDTTSMIRKKKVEKLLV
tara:strand:- start:71 stop:229 length:159 start_codon:yes stop_codon:yes gene_type:complete